jgi:hypothetical protein
MLDVLETIVGDSTAHHRYAADPQAYLASIAVSDPAALLVMLSDQSGKPITEMSTVMTMLVSDPSRTASVAVDQDPLSDSSLTPIIFSGNQTLYVTCPPFTVSNRPYPATVKGYADTGSGKLYLEVTLTPDSSPAIVAPTPHASSAITIIITSPKDLVASTSTWNVNSVAFDSHGATPGKVSMKVSKMTKQSIQAKNISFVGGLLNLDLLFQ